MPFTPNSRWPSLPRNTVLVKKLNCGISNANEMGAASFMICRLVTETPSVFVVLMGFKDVFVSRTAKLLFSSRKAD